MSTLFVVITVNDSKYWNQQLEEMMGRCLKEKFAFIPDTKLVITSSLPSWEGNEEIPRESLYVRYFDYRPRGIALSTMLELLKKRWQTLDLISVMMELQRTVTIKLTTQYKLAEGDQLEWNPITVRENLSCLPRLQMTEEV